MAFPKSNNYNFEFHLIAGKLLMCLLQTPIIPSPECIYSVYLEIHIYSSDLPLCNVSFA